LIIRIDDAVTNIETVSNLETIHGDYFFRTYVTASATVSITGHLVHNNDLQELWRDKTKQRATFAGSGAGYGNRDEFFKKAALTNAAEMSVKKLLENFPGCKEETTRMNQGYDQKE
jgi:hypothetical protein